MTFWRLLKRVHAGEASDWELTIVSALALSFVLLTLWGPDLDPIYRLIGRWMDWQDNAVRATLRRL